MWKAPKPTVREIKSENVCPGCLVMELEGKPTSTEEIELYLSLQFNEDEISINLGKIKFGIRSGELQLNLKNGKIPLSSRELVQLFSLETTKEIQTQLGGEQQSGIEATFGDGKPSIKSNIGNKKVTGISEKYQTIQSNITSKGDSSNPIWVFEPQKDATILKSILKNAKLATADVIQKPCTIEAKFIVDLEDIHITDGTGGIPKVSKKGKVILEKFFIKNFVLPQLLPHLSFVELQYG